MLRKIAPFFAGLLIAFAAVVGCTASAAPPAALLGRWNITVQPENGGGSYPSWMEIESSGFRTLNGQFVGHFGSARPVSRFEFENDKIRFTVPPQWESRPNDLVFEGTLSGDTITGETTDESGQKAKWTARRAPSLARTSPPQWGKSIELFNGRDLTGWKPRDGRANQWIVEDGVLKSPKSGVDLVTTDTFTDFKLRAEFRYPKGSNSGIYLRGRYEVQIQDDFGQEPERHRIGGVYGFLTPVENAAKPAGEWQTVEITLVGRRVTVTLNGKTVLSNQEIPGITGGALDNDESAPGPLLVQGDHGPVEFRRFTITPAR